MSGLTVTHPWVLALLPLALIPLLVSLRGALSHSWLGLVPRDRLGRSAEAGLRILTSLAMVALILALSGLQGTRTGSPDPEGGARVVILLDRSRSMTEPFGKGKETGSEPTKAEAARRTLLDLLDRAPGPRYGLIKFSTAPMLAVPLTGKTDMVRAGLRPLAAKGLTLTDLAAPLAMAAEAFSRAGGGPRIVLLVTDGGSKVEDREKHQLRRWVPRYGLNILWLRLRSPGRPSVRAELDPETSEANRAPRRLHNFFQSLGVPYRVYEVPDGDALDELAERLQGLPVPSDGPTRAGGWRGPALIALALGTGAVLLLALLRAIQRRRW